MSGLGRFAVGALAAGAGAAAWGAHEAARQFRVREHSVPVLPAGTQDVRVLHLSDFHLVPGQRARAGTIRSLVELEPDLVVFTGDALGGADSLPVVLDALDPLLDVPGVFVFGPNDYFGPSFRNPFTYFFSPTSGRPERPVTHLPAGELADALGRRGWLNLNNARGRLPVAGHDVTFVGVDDPHRSFDAFPADDGERGLLHVGVAHAPYARILDEFLMDGCQLAFAGHTHGGQVCVPWYGALVTNCDMPRWRASGLQGWPALRPDGQAISPRRPLAPIPAELGAGGASRMWVNISAGIGTSPFAPVRFACPPEVSLLTLRAER